MLPSCSFLAFSFPGISALLGASAIPTKEDSSSAELVDLMSLLSPFWEHHTYSGTVFIGEIASASNGNQVTEPLL